MGILKTGQKNLFLNVNIVSLFYSYFKISYDIVYRTRVGCNMKCLLFVYSTFMCMSQSRDVAMERLSLRPC